MTPEEVAKAILSMTDAERVVVVRAIVGDASRASRGAVQCPSVNVGAPDLRRCVRDEDHLMPHVDVEGDEWMVGLRCRIGKLANGAAVCGRLNQHEGDCVPRSPTRFEPMAVERLPRTRGVCVCGKPRKEHDAAGLGGCDTSSCAKYKAAR
jgi:hypothetical protein